MAPSEPISLPTFRWPFAAARAGVYLVILALLGMTDPQPWGGHDAPHSTTSKRFELFKRDVIIAPSDSGAFVGGKYRSDEDLAEALEWLRLHNPQSRIVLSTVGSARVGRIRVVLDAIRTAGYHRITIATTSTRPLLLRRLEDLTVIRLDHSHLVELPPDPGGTMRWDRLWY